MIKWITNDTKLAGAIGVLLSELLALLLMGLVLYALQIPLGDHPKWFAVIFVPGLLVLRYHMKQKQLFATKAAIIAFFCSFVVFMSILIKSHLI